MSGDETAREAGSFAKEVKATFPVVHDPKGAVAAKFGVVPLPSNLVIDRKGKVVFSAEGSADLKSMEASVSKAVATK